MIKYIASLGLFLAVMAAGLSPTAFAQNTPAANPACCACCTSCTNCKDCTCCTNCTGCANCCCCG